MTCPQCRGEAGIYGLFDMTAECQTCCFRFRTARGVAFDQDMATIRDALWSFLTLPATALIWIADRLYPKR